MSQLLSSWPFLWRHKVALCRALIAVAAFRIGLLFIQYRRLARWIPAPSKHMPTPVDLHIIMWSVRVTAKVVPHASCLTQSLAAQYLCARAGHATSIRIGVARDENDGVRAHAWLIDGNGILTDRPGDLTQFTPLIDLDGVRR
jgi:hypothetical protein